MTLPMNFYCKYYVCFILVGISLLYQSCIDWENPYDDMGKAKITIADDSEVHDGDNVYADENYTLKLALFLKEFITSFAVRVSGSTTVTDCTVVVTENMDNPFPLDLQFSDSGLILINIVTYYEDGTEKEQAITVNGIITVDKLFYCIGIFLNDSLLSLGSFPSMGDNTWSFDLQLTETWNTIHFVLYHKDEAPQNPLDTSFLVVNYQGLEKDAQDVSTGDHDEVLTNSIPHHFYPDSRKKNGVLRDGG